MERDRKLATVVTLLHQRYVRGNHLVFDAIDAGDEETAEEICRRNRR